MTEQQKMEQAKNVFDTICEAFDDRGWHYHSNSEDMTIECTARGDDLPMEITFKIDASRRLVVMLSKLPFVIQEDKRIDVALAVSMVNNQLVDGSFDYDITSGKLLYRMTNSFIESKLSKEVFDYMLFVAFHTIDEYNDKFLMLAKGYISVEQFLSANDDN